MIVDKYINTFFFKLEVLTIEIFIIHVIIL